MEYLKLMDIEKGIKSMELNLNDKEFFDKVKLKGDQVFINPTPLYKYEEIIEGKEICFGNTGKTNKMLAVDDNTFMSYGHFTNQMYTAKKIFINYFLDNKSKILYELSKIQDENDLIRLEESLYFELYKLLKESLYNKKLYYNQVRKIINLYLEHIVTMAIEIENRKQLVPLLYLPLDKVTLNSVLNESEIAMFNLGKNPTMGSVKIKPTYLAIQKLILNKSMKISNLLGSDFYRIYFDLMWGERFNSDGTNLFLTNPAKK